jgi:hypothetical protein
MNRLKLKSRMPFKHVASPPYDVCCFSVETDLELSSNLNFAFIKRKFTSSNSQHSEHKNFILHLAWLNWTLCSDVSANISVSFIILFILSYGAI